MADFQPFQATLYDTKRVRIADVVTEPYDKITPAMQAVYYERSPHNIVRVNLGRETPNDTDADNKYTRAAKFFRSWLDEGLLQRCTTKAFYLLEQEFEWAGRRYTRRGIIGRVRLTPFSEGIVRPHEKTHAGPKIDRLKLLQTVQAHRGQVFLLCDSGVNFATVTGASSQTPFADFLDDLHVRNRLWEITDAAKIAKLQTAFHDKSFYVADGHHRYETAIAYRDERRRAEPNAGADAPFEFVMATVVDIKDPGLVILPTHRLAFAPPQTPPDLAQVLSDSFLPTENFDSLDAMLHWMNAASSGEIRFGLFLGDTQRFLGLRLNPKSKWRDAFKDQPPLWESLDVAAAHVLLLDRYFGIGRVVTAEKALRYYRDARDVVANVKKGEGSLGLFLNPTRVKQVKAVADAGSRMPQKSTDFYPKLPSGLVIYDLK